MCQIGQKMATTKMTDSKNTQEKCSLSNHSDAPTHPTHIPFIPMSAILCPNYSSGCPSPIAKCECESYWWNFTKSRAIRLFQIERYLQSTSYCDCTINFWCPYNSYWSLHFLVNFLQWSLRATWAALFSTGVHIFDFEQRWEVSETAGFSQTKKRTRYQRRLCH